MRPLIVLITVITLFDLTASKVCTKNAVTTYLKHPLYEFSTKILDRVTQETGGHFVFSPVSSWMQLVNIAEGAKGRTLNQLRNATGRFWKPCMRRRLRLLLNGENNDTNIKSRSLVIVDKFLRVKKSFKKRVELLKTVRVESFDFQFPNDATDKANEILSDATAGDILNAVVPDDFNATLLLINDVISFSNAWMKPFDSGFTTNEKFYHGDVEVGGVLMMKQTNRFNYTEINKINVKVLELPCVDEKHSMLIFLPTKGRVTDLFYNLKKIRLATIYNLFKLNDTAPLVNVQLPRFEIMTEVINLPELLNDMRISRIFNPRLADLEGISPYPINVSIMKQSAVIRVTEKGVEASAGPILRNAPSIDFVANRPFGFMLVQKSAEIPLFAGIYLHPSFY